MLKLYRVSTSDWQADIEATLDPSGDFVIDAGNEMVDFPSDQQIWKSEANCTLKVRLNHLIMYLRRRSNDKRGTKVG